MIVDWIHFMSDSVKCSTRIILYSGAVVLKQLYIRVNWKSCTSLSLGL